MTDHQKDVEYVAHYVDNDGVEAVAGLLAMYSARRQKHRDIVPCLTCNGGMRIGATRCARCRYTEQRAVNMATTAAKRQAEKQWQLDALEASIKDLTRVLTEPTESDLQWFERCVELGLYDDWRPVVERRLRQDHEKLQRLRRFCRLEASS